MTIPRPGGGNQNANLGASSEGDPDWGLPRVKYPIGECNPTLCQPEAGLEPPRASAASGRARILYGQMIDTPINSYPLIHLKLKV